VHQELTDRRLFPNELFSLVSPRGFSPVFESLRVTAGFLSNNTIKIARSDGMSLRLNQGTEQNRHFIFWAKTSMSNLRLLPEITDYTVSPLRNNPKILKECCLASKPWVSRTRTHTSPILSSVRTVEGALGQQPDCVDLLSYRR
jgi:hypothetical protein